MNHDGPGKKAIDDDAVRSDSLDDHPPTEDVSGESVQAKSVQGKSVQAKSVQAKSGAGKPASVGSVSDDSPSSDSVSTGSYDPIGETSDFETCTIRYGRYRVRELLGKGGFGAVYSGVDDELDRPVAIKVPERGRFSKERNDQFLAEARNLAKLNHPQIVSVYDVGIHDDECYIVTELLDGLTLGRYCRENDRIAWPRWVEIVASLADALAHAHSKRVIHRDVKPGNILISPSRGPVLIDFGLALAERNEGDQIGSIRGTPMYMSPEQLQGRGHRIDGRTDIYSLGVVLYQLLCGCPPFSAKNKRELWRQIVHDEPQPPRQLNPDIPRRLESICLRALSKSPSKRPTAASDFADSLKDLIHAVQRPVEPVALDASSSSITEGSSATGHASRHDADPAATICDPSTPPSPSNLADDALADGSTDHRVIVDDDRDSDDRRAATHGNDRRALGDRTTAQRSTAPNAADTAAANRSIAEPPSAASRSESFTSTGVIAGRRHVTLLHILPTVQNNDGSQGVDPEDQIDVTTRWKSTCEKLIHDRGGCLLPSGGHEILACFGFPAAMEDAPRRAVETGFQLRDEQSTLNDAIETSHQCRLVCNFSVHCGSVIANNEDPSGLVGDALSYVSRMDRFVPPGVLAASEATWQLVRSYFDGKPCDDASTKSADGEIYLIESVKSSEEQSETRRTPMVGRQFELQMLRHKWTQACDGIGQMVLLIGEAGIGKSRLLDELVLSVRPEGTDQPATRMFKWFSAPLQQSNALHPIRQFLRSHLSWTADAEENAKRLDEHLAELDLADDETSALLASMLDLQLEGRYALPPMAPTRHVEQTIDALHRWLMAVSANEPLLLVVEDLHWMDASTIALLQRLAVEPIRHRLLCVVTFRPEFSTPWPSSGHQTQIALQRLSRDDIEQIVRAQSSHLPGGLIDRIIAQTDGVPLFVEEVTRMVNDQASADTSVWGGVSDSTMIRSSLERSGSRQSAVKVPETLIDMLTARLQRVSVDPVVVRTAAAIGREFDYGLLADACQLPDAYLDEQLAALVDDQLLFRFGQSIHSEYQFKHALLQDAIYDSMLKRERRGVHDSIAEALLQRVQEGVAVDPSLLAEHLSLADRYAEAISFAIEAGERSTGRGEFPEACEWLTNASRWIEHLPASKERSALELRINVPLSIATLSIGGYADPRLERIYERRMELCRELGDPMQLLHALWAEGSFRIVRDQTDRCLAIADELMTMVETMNDDGATMEALFIRAIVRFYRGDFAESLDDCERGWDLYDADRCLFHMSRTGQHAGIAHLSYMALNLWHLDRPDEARERIQQAVSLADALQHPFMVAFSLHHSSWIYGLLDEPEKAKRDADKLIKAAAEQSFFFWETTGMLFRGSALVALDRHAEAGELLEVGLQRYAATGAALSLPQYHGYAARAALGTGDYQRANDSVEQAMVAVESSGERYHLPTLVTIRSECEAATGDADAARRSLERAKEIASEQGNRALMKRIERVDLSKGVS